MGNRKLNLKQRLLLTGLLLAVTPLLALGIVCWRQFDLVSATALNGSNKLAQAELAQAGETAFNAAVAAQDDVLDSLRAAEAALNGTGGLQFVRRRRTTWQATNQETHVESKVVLPSVSIGQRPDRHHKSAAKPLVDQVRDLTGASCTIFQRMNADGGMLRIATTVLDEQGKRATGSYIPARHADGSADPVLAAVLGGQPYRGRASVLGTEYVTAYEAIRDAKGEIVGMIYAGLPESVEAERLKQRLSSMGIAQRGDVFALSTNDDTRGDLIFSARQGAATLQDRTTRRALVDAVLAHPSEPVMKPYRSSAGVPMVAHLRSFPAWGWLFGVAVPEADFHETAGQIDRIMGRSRAWLVGVFCASLLASLLIWTRYAGVLTARLKAFSRQLQDDGLRILSWSKRLATLSKNDDSTLEEQLDQVEQSAARIQRAARDNEERTQQALLSSAASHTQANQTQHQLAGMQTSMQQLTTVNSKISGLMKTVDEIAFQSRILALNARIEAARAGEAGVSFAVVAEQFGSLAERCAVAARSTTEFLTESTHSTREGLENLENLTRTVEEMGNSAAHVHSTMDQVRHAAGEQVRASAGIAEALSGIKQTMDRREQMTQSASASQALYQLAGQLHQRTNSLTEMVEGITPKAGPQLVASVKKRAAKQPPGQRSAGAKAQANSRSAHRGC